MASRVLSMRETGVGREHAVCEARQRLLGRVRMNGAERALMPRVQRLQQVERLQAPHLTDQDSIRPVSEGRAKEVRDSHGRQRRLLPQWGLRPPCLEPDEIRACRSESRTSPRSGRCGPRPGWSTRARSAAWSCRCRPSGDEHVAATAHRIRQQVREVHRCSVPVSTSSCSV